MADWPKLSNKVEELIQNSSTPQQGLIPSNPNPNVLLQDCYDGIKELTQRDYVRRSDIHHLSRNMRVCADE